MALGRTVAHRNNVHVGYCQGCNVRLLVGEPKAGEGMWPAQLHISAAMMDVLLIAAAEFRDLCAECEVCHHRPHADRRCGFFDVERQIDHCPCVTYQASGEPEAVAFLDWVRPDAVSVGFGSPVNLSPEATSHRNKA